MRRHLLGSSGVGVSELGLGASCLGNLYSRVSDVDADALVREAWNQGVRFFDAAPHYGLGMAERRLGRGLREHAERANLTLSTKVGRLLVPNAESDESMTDMANLFDVPATHHREWDFSPRGVRASLESSLDRMGVERVDLALVHDPDDHLDQALREAVPELVRLRERGRIGAVGVGMNSPEPLVRFVGTGVDAVMVAGRCTLLDQSATIELLPACERNGVSVLAAGVFNSGVLATEQHAQATFDYRPAGADLLHRADRIAQVCTEYGVTLPQAALHYPLTHPAVASVVVGARSAAEVRADAELLRCPVPAELWGRLRDEKLLEPEWLYKRPREEGRA